MPTSDLIEEKYQKSIHICNFNIEARYWNSAQALVEAARNR